MVFTLQISPEWKPCDNRRNTVAAEKLQPLVHGFMVLTLL